MVDKLNKLDYNYLTSQFGPTLHKMNKLRFVVTVPYCDSSRRIQSYIRDAISAWGGQFEPIDGGDHGDGTFGSGDPLGPGSQMLDQRNITVRPIK